MTYRLLVEEGLEKDCLETAESKKQRPSNTVHVKAEGAPLKVAG